MACAWAKRQRKQKEYGRSLFWSIQELFVRIQFYTMLYGAGILSGMQVKSNSPASQIPYITVYKILFQ